MSSDILKLKLQKALLLKELQIANTKIGELKIIAEKKQQKDATMKTTVENKTMSHTVDHFRMPVRSSKVVLKPIETKDVKDREPSVINTKLLKLRQDHIKQEIKRQEAEKIMKEKEITAMKIIKKERDKYRAPPIIPSLLPLRYARSELPCTLEHGFSGQYLSWACPLHNLDYEYYLPFFFDGLQCKEYPVYYLARQGIEDLLFAAKDHPDWILPCLPHLIVPMRNAFFKSDPFLTLGALKALQQLLSCHVEIGTFHIYSFIVYIYHRRNEMHCIDHNSILVNLYRYIFMYTIDTCKYIHSFINRHV